MAAQNFHGVVQVHSLQVPEPDHTFQLRKGFVAGLRRPQVVSGGKGMAGVDADPHARFVFDPLDQVGQMFEGEPEVRTLSGRVFDHGRHAAGLVQCDVDRLGNQVERPFGRNLLQVAAGVEVQPVEPQRFAALHLVEEGCARLLQSLPFGMPEVNQVRVVGQYLRGCIPVRVAGFAEGVDLRCGKRRGHPLALVLREKGEARGPDPVCIGGRVFHTSRSTYVCSDIFHMIVSVLT